nr:hypothetical protein [Actinomadura geliboluensis]
MSAVIVVRGGAQFVRDVRHEPARRRFDGAKLGHRGLQGDRRVVERAGQIGQLVPPPDLYPRRQFARGERPRPRAEASQRAQQPVRGRQREAQPEQQRGGVRRDHRPGERPQVGGLPVQADADQDERRCGAPRVGLAVFGHRRPDQEVQRSRVPHAPDDHGPFGARGERRRHRHVQAAVRGRGRRPVQRGRHHAGALATVGAAQRRLEVRRQRPVRAHRYPHRHQLRDGLPDLRRHGVLGAFEHRVAHQRVPDAGRQGRGQQRDGGERGHRPHPQARHAGGPPAA